MSWGRSFLRDNRRIESICDNIQGFEHLDCTITEIFLGYNRENLHFSIRVFVFATTVKFLLRPARFLPDRFLRDKAFSLDYRYSMMAGVDQDVTVNFRRILDLL